MKTRVVFTKIWEDDYFSSLPLTQKTLFLYLLTNSRIGHTGIYEISDRVIMFETGITKDQLESFKKIFMESKKILFYNGWVKVVNSEKYNSFTGNSNEKARLKELELIPDEISRQFKLIIEGVGEGVNTLPIGCIHPINPNHNININNNINNTSYINNKKKIEYLENIPIEDIEEFKSTTSATEKQIKDKGQELINYCRSHGKRYKDYKAFLRNALAKDYPLEERRSLLADLVK